MYLIIKKFTITKSFLLEMILLNVINAKLCVYNSQGMLKYNSLNLTDIDTVYPELEYFIGNNPFNTYFGDCVND